MAASNDDEMAALNARIAAIRRVEYDSSWVKTDEDRALLARLNALRAADSDDDRVSSRMTAAMANASFETMTAQLDSSQKGREEAEREVCRLRAMVVALAHAYRAETSNYAEHKRFDSNYEDRHDDTDRMSDEEALAYAARVIADPGASEHALPVREAAEQPGERAPVVTSANEMAIVLGRGIATSGGFEFDVVPVRPQTASVLDFQSS